MGTAAENARAGYDEFNRREFEALLVRMTEDSSWHEAPRPRQAQRRRCRA